MEPVRNDTTADRRTAVELAKRLLVDLIWRTAKIEVDGVTFPDTQETSIIQSIGSTSANTTASSAKAACATPAACVNTA